MEKTKIDWCDSTWNPVTGCLHGCEYCYARGIAKRFGGESLDIPHILTTPFEKQGKKQPYPFGFTPTFHKYRLADYTDKKGRNIFVCSMADLFGEWVPDEWIEEIFDCCDKAPQHNYIFLTKNPKRYKELAEKGILRCRNNMWYGISQTKELSQAVVWLPNGAKTFVSIEPLLQRLTPILSYWAIIGAETGKRKNKVVPQKEWIEKIVADCRKYEIPIFMKSSLAEIWGEPLIQEFPEELKTGGGLCQK